MSLHEPDELPNPGHLRHFLSANADDVQYQIILANKNTWGILIPAEIDSLGLELGIPPGFWAQALRT